MKSMAEGYKDSEVTLVSWSKRSHCAVRSEDEKWYQARIINVEMLKFIFFFQLNEKHG